MKIFGRSKTPPEKDSSNTTQSPPEKFQHLRIEKISIRNYKAIEDLTINFPKPEISSDPDITIIGSQNGVGKSSILECCAMVSAAFNIRFPSENKNARYVVREGCSEFEIEADVELENKHTQVRIRVPVRGSPDLEFKRYSREEHHRESQYYTSVYDEEFLTVVQKDPDPLMFPCLLFFHSFRRVPDTLLDGRRHGWSSSYVPWFKKICLRNILESRDILDSGEQNSSNDEVLILNQLLNEFADSDLGQVKLDVSEDGSLDYNIYTKTGSRLRFESLSSGQKDIISTLYLIWFLTRQERSVVLIDEPELHLNAEWHRRYVSNLSKLAPNNQYILATHSPDVAAAVAPDRRLILNGS